VILGVSYTWSRALGVDCGNIASNRNACYGPLSVDRTHVLTFNYVVDMPNFSKKMGFTNNVIGKQILDGWQYSGLTTMTSGAPNNVSISSMVLNGATLTGAALNRVLTGSEDVAPRVQFTCAPKMAHSDKTPDQFINTSCFGIPKVGSQGMDSSFNGIRGPGQNQWDMSIFKKVTFTEKSYLQLRLEAFNVFNHTQWGTLSTAATFNAAGQITNTAAALGASGGAGRAGFGALTNIRANSQRIVQIAAKFYF